MANISVLESGVYTSIVGGNTYYDLTSAGNAYFQLNAPLNGDVILVGSVGGNTNTAVSGQGNVFDFSKAAHAGQKVLAYGSTVSKNWADGVDEFVGGRFTDVVVARASAGSDQKFWTNAGQDEFFAAKGIAKTYVNMGDGFDVAHIPDYVGNFSQAPKVSHWDATKVWEIKSADGSVIQIDNAEGIVFANLAVFDKGLDLGSAYGQAFKIFEAGFDRLPDLGGLSFWAGKILDGTSMVDVARGFVASAEGASKFGGDNAAFVNTVYKNVLNRDADLTGGSFWLNKLNSGEMDRGTVLANFADSAENAANLTKIVGQAFTLDDAGHIGSISSTGFGMY